MLERVPSFEKLVNELSKLPGIGHKTAQRLAYHILRTPKEYADQLSGAMQHIHEKVHDCPQCFSLTENDGLCFFCGDETRDKDLLCIVEEPSDISRIENSGAYKGLYHVLQGTISPLDGVGPEDLKIPQLIKRIKHSQSESPQEAVKEVILALDADLEGDTTVLYIAKILKEMEVKMTRIAHGVPIGGDIDYVDYRTLGRALENRVNV